jgi:hypothetical protein
VSLDLNGDTFGVVYFALSELVVTTAFILTFSPAEKGKRLQASLYAVVRRANPVSNSLYLSLKKQENRTFWFAVLLEQSIGLAVTSVA